MPLNNAQIGGFSISVTEAMVREFTKPAQSNGELLKQWQIRGLIMPDLERAERYLRFISYYRLSAYAIPFHESGTSHNFRPGTTFDDILTLYVFDRELRILVMDAIERIEIAVRSRISNVMALSEGRNGQKNGAFWYLDEQHFKDNYDLEGLHYNVKNQISAEKNRLARDIARINSLKSVPEQDRASLIARSKKENFLRHYISNYNSPGLPPCWMMMELLTWGELSRLYAGLKSTAMKKEIARELGLNSEILESWLVSFNSIRNFCAHHSRLWNRELGVKIKLPRSECVRWLHGDINKTNPLFSGRIYSILVSIQSVLYTVSPRSSWAKRLKALMDKYPDVPRYSMGMPDDWWKDGFWTDVIR